MKHNSGIALLLRRIGPYHHARFNHAGRELDLHVIETRPGSEEYPWDDRIANRESKSSYNQYRLPISPNPERGWRGPKLKKKIEAVLTEINPDVIVTTGWADAEYHAALLWARKRKIPCVVISDSTESDFKRFWIMEWTKNKILKNYSSAIVAGKRSQDYIEKLDMPSDRIFEAWDVVDNDYFKRTAVKLKNDPELKDKYLLPDNFGLCVARFIPEKNLFKLIDVFHDYIHKNETDINLIIAGNGLLEDNLKTYTKEKGLGTRVYFPGFISYDEIPFFYGNAKWVILPSIKDTWGLVINEALACELPVIVSDKCGCSVDLVQDGMNGYIVDPLDDHQIAEAIRKIETGNIKKSDSGSLTIIDSYDLDSFTEGLKNSVYSAMNEHSRIDNITGRFLSYLISYI